MSVYGTEAVAAGIGAAAPPEMPDDASSRHDPWPEPREIPNGLSPVETFDLRLLPESLLPWIEDIAERIQCPPDFPAVAAIVGLASVVGRRVTIRPQRKDDWTVTPNLWGAVIGRSGVLKSPAVAEAVKPLKRLEVEAAREHAEAVKQWEAVAAVLEVKGVEDKTYMKKELKAGRSAEEIGREMAARDEAPPEPPRQRFIVNDATVEKLGEILADNPAGTLVFRDELVGFLRQLEKGGREDARAFYLEAWNGDGRYESNRIMRGTTIIENCTLSLLGSIQPGPLREYLKRASGGGRGADGLVQRFQLAVWPDVTGEWSHVDRWRNTEARERAFATFGRLAHLDPDSVGGERDPYEPDDPPFLRFDDAAQERFIVWRTELEHRVRSGDEHPALESHLAKYRSLVPSLALLFHLADGGTGPVPEGALLRGLAWADYLESHARRMYGAATGADPYPAQALAKRIRAGDVADGFALRDVYRNHWGGLATADEVRAAVEMLDGLDWLRSETEEAGGRPGTRFRISPRVEVIS